MPAYPTRYEASQYMKGIVRQNGVRAITGDLLQSVLDQMLDASASRDFFRDHEGTNDAYAQINWGFNDSQSCMRFQGWGIQSTGSGNAYLGEFKYVWGYQYLTKWDKIINDTEWKRWMQYESNKLRFYINTPYSSMGDPTMPGGTEVFAADQFATSLLANANGNPRVLFASGTDTSGSYTVINGLPRTAAGTLPYHFMRIGANYCYYYVMNEKPFATMYPGSPNLTIWDGLGSFPENKAIEITADKINFLKPTNITGSTYLVDSGKTINSAGVVTSWYRIYSDGWKEQGGAVYIGGWYFVGGVQYEMVTVTYPKPFTNRPVMTNVTPSGHVSALVINMHIENDSQKTSTQIYARSIAGDFQFGNQYLYWQVKGY
jgi:hypothetical protein